MSGVEYGVPSLRNIEGPRAKIVYLPFLDLVSSNVMSKLREPIRIHSDGVKMQVATNDLTIDLPTGANSTASEIESWRTVEVLEVLLAHSIHLRDLYKNARWQTANIQFRR
jgi:hypothetical protein